MNLTLLIVLTACLPAAWGYCTFWLIAKTWPPGKSRGDEARRSDAVPAPHDYQI